MKKTFGLVGKSGSGKTTLVEKLIPEIKRRGFSVSTIKHTHHRFDMDKPGKDSYRHRDAGAGEVLLASSKRWALLHEIPDTEDEPDLPTLLSRLSDVDLVLVEGFKSFDFPKIEIHRPSLGREPLWPHDPNIVAVASDGDIVLSGQTKLDLNDTMAIVDFILDFSELTGARKGIK